MTASVFFTHHFLLIFATQLIETRYFPIFEHVLSQFLKVININFAFGKLHFLATQMLLHGTIHFIRRDIT